jgi:hypothetical protein
MKSDEIYLIVEHKTKLKCGKVWNDMNYKERNTAMLKMAIIMLKECYKGSNND